MLTPSLTERKPSRVSEAPKNSIQVIERMMTLLDVLAESPDPVSLKTLVQRTGLHPSTAHRILASLAGSRLVERQDAGSYQLGIRLLELGNLVKSRINLREVALPFMQQLHEKSGRASTSASATTTRSSISNGPRPDAPWCGWCIWWEGARPCT